MQFRIKVIAGNIKLYLNFFVFAGLVMNILIVKAINEQTAISAQMYIAVWIRRMLSTLFKKLCILSNMDQNPSENSPIPQ